ncbi:MAG: hypothetical protein PHI37_05710 [Candidatus Gracilibacteria bacterium]|nr:hypothetical protein [Candidatus Gracilibacteria bacterium]
MSELFSLGQVLSAFENIKQEKGIEKLLNNVKEKCFGDRLDKNNIEEFKDFVRDFYSMYYLMKKKFKDEYRDDGVRYFEHLREVVNNVLDLPNPNTQKVLIAIAHDSIEDTNKTFEGLEEDYGYEVALAVQAISKEPWEEYEDFDIKDENERKDQAKKERNKVYFGHLKNFETFKNHIKNLALVKGFELDEEKIEEIAKNALDVKFADRIHNLSTQWDPNDLEQVRKKVDETKQYFLDIAKETNIDAYNKMQSLILTLEIRLINANSNIKKVLQ